MRSVLVIGQSWSHLARDITTRLGVELLPLTVAQFADTESFVSLADSSDDVSWERLKNKNILLVYQLSRFISQTQAQVHGSTNDQLVGLLECIDLLKQAGANSITVVLPYLPYSRQEKCICKKHEGAASMLGRCLKSLGVTTVVVCDLHAPVLISNFAIPIQHITLEGFWADMLRKNVVTEEAKDHFCILSPDLGGRERAQKVATLLGLPFAYVCKKRVENDVVIAHELVGDVRRKRIILIDDIIDTGRTALSACDLAFAHGAQQMYGCFTHTIFSQGAFEQLARSRFEKIFITDTIINNFSENVSKLCPVSVNEYITDRIVELVNQRNIFDV